MEKKIQNLRSNRPIIPMIQRNYNSKIISLLMWEKYTKFQMINNQMFQYISLKYFNLVINNSHRYHNIKHKYINKKIIIS